MGDVVDFAGGPSYVSVPNNSGVGGAGIQQSSAASVAADEDHPLPAERDAIAAADAAAAEKRGEVQDSVLEYPPEW